MFGYERKTKDGLIERSIGKIREATDGTLFLNNINELDKEVQAKLLRFLQEGQFQSTGSKTIYKSGARIIASSNANLEALVKKKKFREDLCYRLSIFPIKIPALSERDPEDIKLLADNFCYNSSINENKKIKGISDNTMKLLVNYDWEDNVRQLKNYVFRAVVLCDDEYLETRHFPQIMMIDNQPISVAKLSEIIRKPRMKNSETFDIFDDNGECKSLEDIEKEIVNRLHELYDGNLSEIAKKLEVSRSTVYRKLNIPSAMQNKEENEG